jgi:hypothetical protein
MSQVKERKVSATFDENTRRYGDDLSRDTRLGDENIIFWPDIGQMEFSYLHGGRMLGFRRLHRRHQPMFFSAAHAYTSEEASDAEKAAIVERMMSRQAKRPFKGLDIMISEAAASVPSLPAPMRHRRT